LQPHAQQHRGRDAQSSSKSLTAPSRANRHMRYVPRDGGIPAMMQAQQRLRLCWRPVRPRRARVVHRIFSR
jgi:hypothetical protein